MDYKNDVKYKIGRNIFIVAIIEVGITFIMMAFGQDVAIIPFFIGCAVAIIGNAVMVSVKYKYQSRREEELTFVEKVNGRWYDLKEFFKRKSVTGTVMLLALLVSIGFSAVYTYRGVSLAYEYSGAYNAGYKYNLSLYEKNTKLSKEATDRAEKLYWEAEVLLEQGKKADAAKKERDAYSEERDAARYESLAEKNLIDSKDYYKTAQKLKPQRDAALKVMYKVLAINVIIAALFVVEVIIRRKLRGKRVE